MSLRCPDCGSPMVLKRSRYGLFYSCSRWPACNGTHGAHPNGKPLGTPADRATKDARIAAHAVFDRLWKPEVGGTMRRKDAYVLLRRLMGLPAEKAHIGMFTQEQCEQLIQRLAECGAVTAPTARGGL